MQWKTPSNSWIGKDSASSFGSAGGPENEHGQDENHIKGLCFTHPRITERLGSPSYIGTKVPSTQIQLRERGQLTNPTRLGCFWEITQRFLIKNTFYFLRFTFNSGPLTVDVMMI